MSYHNGTAADQEQTVEYNRSVTKSTTWSTSTKFEGTVSMSVSAGAPGVGEVSGGFSVTVGAEESYSMTNDETITESDQARVTVPAGKTVTVEFSVGRAIIDLAYSARVKITCLNGSELVFPTTGNYHGVAYTDVNIDTKESGTVMNVE